MTQYDDEWRGAPRQRTYRRRMNAGEWFSAIVIIGALVYGGKWY